MPNQNLVNDLKKLSTLIRYYGSHDEHQGRFGPPDFLPFRHGTDGGAHVRRVFSNTTWIIRHFPIMTASYSAKAMLHRSFSPYGPAAGRVSEEEKNS